MLCKEKSMFINRLTDKGDYLPTLANKIHQSNHPLFLYGAGKCADVLYQLFTIYNQKNDVVQQVKFNEIVVSVLPKNQILFHGQQVKEFDEAAKEYQDFDVIIGVQVGLEQVLDKLKNNPKVRNIFFYDSTLRGCEDLLCHFSRKFLKQNDTELTLLYNELEDELSQKTMIAFFNQHLTGNCEYVDEVFISEHKRYFPDFIELRNDEVFIDCGAYIGDTATAFFEETRNIKYKDIFSFEPDTRNFEQLCQLKSSIPNLNCFNKGTWNEETTLRFSDSGSIGSAISSDGDIQIEVDTIDNILNGQSATYIKMDIEGAELPSLMGAENTIRNYKPKLAISVYHKYDDLLTIPKYIKSLNSEYKFYLRVYYKPYFNDLVLYAV